MSKLWILFGPSGVGKSYVGQLIKDQFGFYFYEADEDLTAEILEAINHQLLFTDPMRWDFYEIVCSKIASLQKHYANVVVSQALIKEMNRIQIHKHFPEAKFIQIQANQEIMLQRILARKNEVNLEYAKKIAEAFEQPLIAHHCLINNDEGSVHLMHQLEPLMKDNVLP